MSEPIKNRYDFVFFFDVKDGNPNGDPDQVNLPRIDTEDQRGIVTDVCIKRKVRNYVALNGGLKSPHDIFIRQRDIADDDSFLNALIAKAEGTTTQAKRGSLCKDYWDIRAFGAVLSTGESESSESSDETEEGAKKKSPKKKVKGGGTVRGPVQFTFSRSEDRIYQAEHSITRCCVTTEKERDKQLANEREFASTFGRKATVPYAMYRMHGFVSAVDAAKTKFSEEDLQLLWKSLINAFEHDRAAARGEMNPRKLVIFKHNSHLGNELSGRLFERVTVTKMSNLPRSKDDYLIEVNKDQIPSGIEIKVWPEESVY
ncbi:CRISPR-associated protein Csd2 [Desulfomicrobium norvegicum]|uniref:CRISPR-associated protein Csd2 n=1 Tax=Desulfomicrobium norvegicum (strain DSM 1741 / NCIMB 8310) TaxID=52561 RepID=A0A8G2FF09_DESNO|nr:type I-C CRISPR-associated protein Cas7/Csd2 [Desulfomicrobium norvegicum]SFL91351.1 CRISPR-associated protein Csd2 [Desulfomicrobium norvegicum]